MNILLIPNGDLIMKIYHKSSSWNANILTQRMLGFLAGKPDETSFATNMHFILSDKQCQFQKKSD
jgi:hypothetical protein